MTNESSHHTYQLTRVEIVESPKNPAKKSLVMTLAGHETALADAQGKFRQDPHESHDFFVDRDARHNALKISAPLSDSKTAIDVFEEFYDRIKSNEFRLRLGGVSIKPAANKVALDKQRHVFSPEVTIEPAVDPLDSKNIAGEMTMGLIHRKMNPSSSVLSISSEGGWSCYDDAKKKLVGLLNLEKHYDSPAEAIYKADEKVREIEKNYKIFYPPSVDLQLAGLRVEPKRKVINGKPVNITMTDIILRGSRDKLQEALRLLKRNYDGEIKSTSTPGMMTIHVPNVDDSSKYMHLVSVLHNGAGCELPVNIIADSTPTTPNSSIYNPSLTIEARQEIIADDRDFTALILSYYIASRIIANEKSFALPNQLQEPVPHIVILQPYDSETKAQHVAERIAGQMRDTLRHEPGLQRSA